MVVILNWNGLVDTLECLQSVGRQGYPDLEVVVIDNGSRPPEPEELRAQAVGAHVILSPTNVGFAGGCNIGMRYALAHGADYVWLLNNDSVGGPGCLAELVRAAEADDRVGLLSPVVCDYGAPHQIRFAGTVVDFRQQDRIHLTSVEEMLRRDDADRLALTGTALLVKRRVMERTGFFDERYFAYVEDTDYSTRAVRDGFTTRVVPAAVLYHKEGRSLGGLQSPVREFLLVRNWYLFWSTHLKGWRRWGYRRRYLSWVLDRALAARLMPPVADESLNGAWNALCGRWGSWEQRRPMPSGLKAFVQRWVLGWHPYFWIRLLAGDLRGLSGEAIRRAFRRKAQPR